MSADRGRREGGGTGRGGGVEPTRSSATHSGLHFGPSGAPKRAAWRPFWFPGMLSQRRGCRLVENKLKFSAQPVHYRPLHGQSRPWIRPSPKVFATHTGTVASWGP